MNHSSAYLNPKIATHAVRTLVNFAECQGLDRDVLLSAVGLTEDRLNDGRLLIDVSRHEDLYELAASL